MLAASKFFALLAPVAALDNGLAITPPMGWRSWNCFHGAASAASIRAVADAMASRARAGDDGAPTSLVDLGYARLGVDDGWQDCGAGYDGSFHAADGTPLLNASKFDDLAGLVAYGHGPSRGAREPTPRARVRTMGPLSARLCAQSAAC